jgi:tetratricopeptide (TPR) repeat protein
MKGGAVRRAVVAMLAGILALSCAARGPYERGRRALDAGDYPLAVEILGRAAAADPGNWRVARDLGAAHLQSGNLGAALGRLEAARTAAPADPAVLFYLGACYEKLDRTEDALDAYEAYVAEGRDSGFRKRVETRLRGIAREAAAREARRLAAREDSLATVSPPDVRTLAVTHFGTVGTRDEIEPLGAALSEWLVSDLAKVESADLVIVERIRLDAILRELEFSRSRYVDSTTAPRVGRLLSVHRIVSGSLIGGGEDRIRADLRLTRTATGAVTGGGSATGSIDGFVALEKALVFELLETLGIRPTEFERARIETAPTRDLRAILAHGRGLLYERRGLLSEAKESYRNALAYDAGYGLASAAFAGIVIDPGDLDALLDAAATEFGEDVGAAPSGTGERLEATGDLIGGDAWPVRPHDARPYPFPAGIPEPPETGRGGIEP